MGVVGLRIRRSVDDALEKVEKPKAEEKEEYNTRYVPEEVVLTILAKLPVKSLLRFRCVSKQWSYLISQITTRIHKVLIPAETYYYGSEGNFTLRSIDQNSQGEDIDMVVGKSRACNKVGCDSACFHLHGPCNGLLLIGLCDDFFLWNPSLRSCVSHLRPCDNESLLSLPGLCYDSYKNDYLVVMLTLSYRSEKEVTEAFVGRFNTNLWKQVEFQHADERFDSFELGPMLNNHPHWLRCPFNEQCNCIVYFDSQMEKFVDLPAPSLEFGPVLEKHAYVFDSLGVLDGCLCMARYYAYTSTTIVLLMKEYGVKESWTLYFKFEYHVETCFSVVPLAWIRKEKNREVLMLVRECRREKIVVYDIDNNVGKEIGVEKVDMKSNSPVVYEETVMVIPGLQKENIFRFHRRGGN